MQKSLIGDGVDIFFHSHMNRCCFVCQFLIIMVVGVVLTGIFFTPGQVMAGESPSLNITYSNQLGDLLSRVKSWRQFPTHQNRDAWENIPEQLRLRLIAGGEKQLGENWPSIQATSFLEFYRTGNKANYLNKNHERRNRLSALVLAECIEGKGRFIDDIVNGIWIICEETFWGNSPSTFLQNSEKDQRYYNDTRQLYKIRTKLPDITKPGVDLWVGETAGLLSWTFYLLGPELDAVSPLIRERIGYEIDRRVLTPCLERDFLWMKGRGNWSPWVTSNWLTAVLLLEQDETRRITAIQKIFHTLDYFMQHYPEDGASHEGPGYWRHAAASLFDCLELLFSASDGAITLFDHKLVKDMGRYIYRVHIADQYYMNFADASGKLSLPAELLIRYGRKIDDPALVALGNFELHSKNYKLSGSLYRQLAALFNTTADSLVRRQVAPPFLRDAWLPGVQVMAARSKQGDKGGLFLGVKGGSNGEGHNHNDVGNFIIYADGHPVIIDVGPETYTAKNSSPQRYDIWTMQSGYHNLPTVGSIMQHAGKKYAARDVVYRSEDTIAMLSMDIAEAYPSEAGLSSWKRTLQLNRGVDITLTEKYSLSKSTDEISLSLMTPCQVRQTGPGLLELTHESLADPVEISFNSQKLKFSPQVIPLTDERLLSIWGEQITRILLTTENPPLQDIWTIKFIQR